MALIVALLRVGTLRRAAVVLRPPVTGRWLAHNSPATRVPSHGIQSYGQAYAIDLVADPADGSRPGFAWWPPFAIRTSFRASARRCTRRVEGTVVRVHDRERDHYSRTSPFGIGFLLTVELFREFFGPSRILGNHVVIDLGDGTFAALAHLERRSIRVREGDRVAVGERIADCGNSGNSSEPHLHLQVMDHPRPGLAAGVPFRFMTGDGGALAHPTQRCASRGRHRSIDGRGSGIRPPVRALSPPAPRDSAAVRRWSGRSGRFNASGTSNSLATGTSVEECATIDRAMHTAISRKTASASGMPELRTGSPYTTEANPLKRTRATAAFSRRSSPVRSSDSSSVAGRNRTSASMPVARGPPAAPARR